MYKHFIDNKNKRIIAKVVDCELNAINRILKRFPYIGDDYIILNDNAEIVGFRYGLEKALMKHKYETSVTCHGSDVYDESKGIHEVDKKLTEKLNKITDNHVEKWVKHYTKLLEQVNTKKNYN